LPLVDSALELGLVEDVVEIDMRAALVFGPPSLGELVVVPLEDFVSR
jgi:hypothetical protein